MSTSDRLLLVLHIGFAIFMLGPLTAATHSTPRYIRKRNATVVRYLHRTTQIYGIGTLGIFLFGLLLADGDLAEMWLSVSMTLFIVALVLLLIVERDQRKATHLLEAAAAEAPAQVPSHPKTEEKDGEKDEAAKDEEKPAKPATEGEIAQVERGRIAALSGVVSLIWLVILVLMVWNG
ncbi:hypothetical protein OHR68_28840 [Spirillospora sp. NBC_00431]